MSAEQLRRLVDGYQASQVIYAVAALGLADLLAAGPRTIDELAAASEADPETLYRLLRAVAALGVFHEQEERLFSLTELGRPLLRDAPDSIAGWAMLIGRPYYREAWSHLVDAVRSGENAFRLVHGTGVWEYRAQRPEESAIFDRAMQANSRIVVRSLLDAYDFGRFETVADLGGGNGTLLAALLDRHPALRGILFDQPHVVAGVDLGPRCEIVGGSFFDAVPEGADAYLLKWILHDWEDAESAEILRAVARTGGTVLVIERLLAGPNEDPAAKLSDINMLVVPGGRERTLEEFGALFASAGYRLQGATPTASGMYVIEGVPSATA